MPQLPASLNADKIELRSLSPLLHTKGPLEHSSLPAPLAILPDAHLTPPPPSLRGLLGVERNTVFWLNPYSAYIIMLLANAAHLRVTQSAQRRLSFVYNSLFFQELVVADYWFFPRSPARHRKTHHDLPHVRPCPLAPWLGAGWGRPPGPSRSLRLGPPHHLEDPLLFL